MSTSLNSLSLSLGTPPQQSKSHRRHQSDPFASNLARAAARPRFDLSRAPETKRIENARGRRRGAAAPPGTPAANAGP